MGDDGFADADVGRDGAAHVTGEQNRAEDCGSRKQINKRARQFQNAEPDRQRRRPARVLESLLDFCVLRQFHDSAEHQEQGG